MNENNPLKDAWLAIVLGHATSFYLPLANRIPENIQNFLHSGGFTFEFVQNEEAVVFRLLGTGFNPVDLPIEGGRHVAKNGWVFLTTTARGSLDALVKKEQRRIARYKKYRAKKLL
jgi:hypothetical protein